MESLLITVVTLAAIFGVVTLALNLQYGHGGLINFGVVAYFAAGAYAYVIITQPAPSGLDEYVLGLGMPVWVGLAGAGLAGTAFALVTGWPCLRLRGEYLALTTFAFAEVFHSFIVNERRFANGTRGLVGVPRPFREVVEVVPYDIAFALVSLAFLALTFVAVQRLVSSPFGRTLGAIRDDEVAVTTSGKDIGRFRLQVFLLSALLAGLAGAFYVSWTTLATPELFTAEVTFVVWIALVVGGVGSNWGAVAGIFLITAFEELVATIPFTTARSAQVASSLQGAALGLLLVVFLRWQPLQRLRRERP